MAKFTTQGRLKPILNGEPKDPFQFKLRGGGGSGGGLRLVFGRHPVRVHKGRSSGGVFGGCRSRVWCSFVDKYRHFSVDDADEEDELDGFESDDLDYFRGLVLDISYRPVNVVCWRRAICLEFMEKADVLEYYDQTVNSPGGSFYIPAVLRVPHLLQVVKRRRVKRNLSRKNIFYRDNFTCQYCSSHESLTIDHVIPMTWGGEWTWENLVAACARCNSRKGSKTLEEANMKLIKVPKAPKDYDILAIPLTSSAIKMLRMRKGMPEEWRQYLANSKSSAEP